MFDQMTFTKAFAALCGALLIFLFTNWAAHALFTVGSHGHGEEVHQAFLIDTGVSEAEAGGEAVEEVPFAEIMASADAAAGEKVFAKCKACHKIDGSNATGPHLDGVVGRAVASVADFTYSDGMKEHGGEWTPEALSTFLHNPKAAAPGTKMAFAGLPKATDRANLIAYLQTVPN
jgi:cytochrome c